LVEFDVLLGEGMREIVERRAGDGEYSGAIELGVIEPVREMNATGAGSGKADAEASAGLVVRAGHESGRFFVAHLNEANLVLPGAQSFHDAVDTVARKAKDNVYSPLNKALDQHVGCSHFSPI